MEAGELGKISKKGRKWSDKVGRVNSQLGKKNVKGSRGEAENVVRPIKNS